MNELPGPKVKRILAVSYVNKDYPMRQGLVMQVGGLVVGILEAAKWHEDLGLWEVCIIAASNWRYEEHE